jgi:hypothetical protein
VPDHVIVVSEDEAVARAIETFRRPKLAGPGVRALHLGAGLVAKDSLSPTS